MTPTRSTAELVESPRDELSAIVADWDRYLPSSPPPGHEEARVEFLCSRLETAETVG